MLKCNSERDATPEIVVIIIEITQKTPLFRYVARLIGGYAGERVAGTHEEIERKTLLKNPMPPYRRPEAEGGETGLVGFRDILIVAIGVARLAQVLEAQEGRHVKSLHCRVFIGEVKAVFRRNGES